MNLSLDFAFEGFRVIRQKPVAILVWGLILLIGNGAGLYVIASMAGAPLHSLQQLQAAGTPTEASAEAMMGLMPPILSAYAIAIPLLLLADSLVACAVYRAVLGRDGGFAWLALGPAELRQFIVSILFFLVAVGVTIVAAMFAALLGAPIGMIFGPMASAVTDGALIVAILAAIALRLSFCGVQTFDEGRVNLFGSWSLTVGRFWRLATGYVIAAIMILLVDLLCLVIFIAFVAAFNGGDLKALDPVFNNTSITLDMFRTPVTLAYLIVANGLVAPLTLALSAGAPAAAYRALRALPGAARAQDVF